jgi:hypothetical protein
MRYLVINYEIGAPELVELLKKSPSPMTNLTSVALWVHQNKCTTQELRAFINAEYDKVTPRRPIPFTPRD